MVTAMMGDRARSDLVGTRFAALRWVADTGSTNRDLLDLAATGAPDGTVLVADHQTAGRGRLDRSWHALPGASLLLSVLFRPAADAVDAHLLTTAVGLSAAEACELVAGVGPGLKWPNDLVVASPTDGSTRKLGGILAESTVRDGRLDAVVVGLGLNVNWPRELPADLADIAIALNHFGGEVDREALLVALLRRLGHWGTVTPAELMAGARDRSATLGHEVRVDLGREQFEGRAVELTDRGELVVETAAGERRTVVVGDVVHVRPTP